MKYIVYLTTNKINNKIYVGVHSTENPNIFDGYLGCGVFNNAPKTYKNGGTIFQNAVAKYGPNNFYRQTLKIFDNKESALAFEKEIVNDEFIERTDVYNMVIGGGNPPDLSKKVFQFDLDGNLIKEWKNQIEVTEFYKCNKDRIWMIIKDKRSYLDCYWSHEETLENLEEYRLSKTKNIYQYNLEGKLLNTFDNVKEASIELDLDKNRLISCIADRRPLEDCYFLTILTPIEEVIEWRKNKNGGKKKVYRYTLNDEYDTEFKSLADAAKSCGLANGHSISTAVKNFSISGGYKWSYVKSPKFIEIKIQSEPKSKKVAVYNSENEIIETFNTATECSKKYPGSRRVLRGERKKSYGYTFKYID